jgi:hypothetical protein
MRISRSLRLVVGVLAMSTLAGCAHSKGRKAATSEPPLLSGADGADTVIVEAPEVRTVTAADRHPVLRRPREYYDKTNGNKFSKTVAATVIGVPSGIGAEVKQIFAGQPAVN